MFRLRLTLIYLGLTIVGVIVTLMLLNGAKATADDKLVSEITKSHLVYDQIKQVRDLQLRDVAQAVAQSEVQVYMAVLKKHRKTMYRVQREIFKRFAGDEQKDARREALEAEYDDVHKTMAQELATQLAVYGDAPFSGDEGKAKFVVTTMKQLAECQSQSVKQCSYELAREALVRVTSRLRKSPVYGLAPSVLIAGDDRLVGLVDADRKFYAHDSAFAENFAVVRQVKKGVIARDIAVLDTSSHKGTFFITAAPMFTADREFLGVILAGSELDSGLLKAEKKVLGRDITYFDGKKPIRSTLDQRALDALVIDAKPVDEQNPQLHTLQTEETIAQFIPLTGNWSTQNIRVAVSARRDSARALDGVTVWIPLVFGLLFLLGVGLFMWAVHLHLKPALEIDSGIHEVISGNRDYIFPDKYDNELWSAMAQALNRMVGELVGREMVDEEGFDDWAKSYLKSAHEDEDGEYEEEDDEASDEADDAYYHRIFREFQELNKKAGNETLPYLEFVEKVSRTEKALTKKLGLSGVRLQVEAGKKGPVLKPIKRREE